MTVYHLIDALPAAFFGLLGIWAAVVRRHWFLRFAVVCVFLLVCLLIPAYEVVLEFGIAIALIMAGIWLARGRRHEPFRFSLESALLVMVVVAIGSAVIAKAPEFGWQDWLSLFSTGCAVALISLLSLWLVFGQASLWWRLLMGLLGFLAFTTLYYFCQAIYHLLFEPDWNFAWVESLWQRVIDPDVLSWGLGHCLPTSLLGFATLCSVLVLARGSHWFADPNDDQSQPSNKRTLAARLGLVVLMLCIFSPLCYLFYRLMTPTPYPIVEMPADNGWDDLIAAGKMLDDNFLQLFSNLDATTTPILKLEIDKISEPLEMIDRGLKKEHLVISRSASISQDQREMAEQAVFYSGFAMLLRLEYVKRTQSVPERIRTANQLLAFSDRFNSDVGFDEYETIAYLGELIARKELESLLPKLSSQLCQEIIGELVDFDIQRGTYENCLRNQHIADQNSDWLTHLQLLLEQWSPANTFHWDKYYWNHFAYLNSVRDMRLLIIQLALQAYFLDNNSLPESLQEIVPRYLTAIPTDPRTKQPFQYKNLWGGYALISVSDGNSRTEEPMIVAGPAAPYLWQRLQESWHGFRTWLQGLSLPPKTTAPR